MHVDKKRFFGLDTSTFAYGGEDKQRGSAVTTIFYLVLWGIMAIPYVSLVVLLPLERAANVYNLEALKSTPRGTRMMFALHHLFKDDDAIAFGRIFKYLVFVVGGFLWVKQWWPGIQPPGLEPTKVWYGCASFMIVGFTIYRPIKDAWKWWVGHYGPISLKFVLRTEWPSPLDALVCGNHGLRNGMIVALVFLLPWLFITSYLETSYASNKVTTEVAYATHNHHAEVRADWHNVFDLRLETLSRSICQQVIAQAGEDFPKEGLRRDQYDPNREVNLPERSAIICQCFALLAPSVGTTH